jgi:hypothetical protein
MRDYAESCMMTDHWFVRISPLLHQQLRHLGVTLDSSHVERGTAVNLKGPERGEEKKEKPKVKQ